MNTQKRRYSAHPAVLAAKNLARKMMEENPSLRRQRALDEIASVCGHENWNRFSGFFFMNQAAPVPGHLAEHLDPSDPPETSSGENFLDPRDFITFYGEPARSAFFSFPDPHDGTVRSFDLRPGYLLLPGRKAPAGIVMKHSIVFLERQDFERSLKDICDWIGLPLLARVGTEKEFVDFKMMVGSAGADALIMDGGSLVTRAGWLRRSSFVGLDLADGSFPGIVTLPWNAAALPGMDVLFAQARSLGLHLILPVKPGNREVSRVWDDCSSVVFRSPAGLKVAHDDPFGRPYMLRGHRDRFFSPRQAATISRLFRECAVCVWNPDGGYPVDFGVRKVGKLILSTSDVEVARERHAAAAAGRSDTFYTRDAPLPANFGVLERHYPESEMVAREVRRHASTCIMGFAATSHEEAAYKARVLLADPSAEIITVRSEVVQNGDRISGSCDVRNPRGIGASLRRSLERSVVRMVS